MLCHLFDFIRQTPYKAFMGSHYQKGTVQKKDTKEFPQHRVCHGVL